MPTPNHAVAKAIQAVPGPERADDATVVIAARFKAILLRLVTEGVAVRDKMTGEQIIDADGKPAFRLPNAAELGQIRQYIAKAEASGAINDHAHVQDIMAEFRALGWKFPELGDEPDEASKDES
jgi:hypothetical protein